MHLLPRRSLLKHAACGFGSLALCGLLPQLAHGNEPFQLHHAAKAKRVIFIFMQGGPSHVDSFDYKPRLFADDGKQMDFRDARTIAKSGDNVATTQRIMKPLWDFKQRGQCGRWTSDLFPAIGEHVDDLCFVHSLHTEGIAHGPATLFLHNGATNFIRPSMGSWISYGLGSANNNLPTFVSISPSAGNGGSRNYGSAFLPARFQGTAIGRAGAPVSEATIRNLVNGKRSAAEQREQYDLVQSLSSEQQRGLAADDQVDAMIESYELAWRMQQHAPDILDLSKESPATLALYGIGEKETDNYGRQCLMARRLAEAGVRYIQVTYGDNSANPAWDQHSNLPKHGVHAKATDRPVAGLLADLKQRGLLEDTIVWWGGEFGRTPYAEKNGTGRDHNSRGFTHWVAGGGFKAGHAHGATDEFGHQAAIDKVHMHDLHATILHQLGLNHERLTFRHDGRDYRLTDVHGHVVHDIIA
jgi:hypothetical protein